MINAMPTIELPATERVGQTIRGWIREGRLALGDRLPTELAISQQISVSRTTVRSALRALHQSGEIAPVVDGRGWVVAARAEGSAGRGADAAGRMVGVVSGLGASMGGTTPPIGGRNSGLRAFILMGVLQGLSERGYTAAVEAVDPLAADEAREMPSRRAWLATGDVFAHASMRARLDALRRAGMPVAVQYDTDEDLPFDRVVSDHAAGTAKLAEWLFSRGCRKILHYLPLTPPGGKAGPELRWLRMRQRGLAEAYDKAGLPQPPPVPAYLNDQLPASRESLALATDVAYGFLARAFAADPGWDAVLCLTDGHVASVMEALRRFGDAGKAAIPVAGYDNYWNDCPETFWTGHRPAATVDKGNLQLGRALVEVLDERLADPGREGPIVRRVAPELKVVEA